MFCSKCGKYIDPNALFCTFCGTPANGSSVPAEQAPTTENSALAEQVTNAPSAPTITAEPPVTASVQFPSTEPSATDNVAPTTIPHETQTVPMANTEPKPAERMYTFGHLALCLGAVGIMAIIAGIFAGLYFSVI